MRTACPKNDHVCHVHCAFWAFARLDLDVFLRYCEITYKKSFGKLPDCFFTLHYSLRGNRYARCTNFV